MTWEPKDNLSEDLVRDFEEAYWQAVKNADSAFLDEALQYGGETVANITDSDRRTALHFAAALNQADLISKFIKAGAHAVAVAWLDQIAHNHAGQHSCAQSRDPSALACIDVLHRSHALHHSTQSCCDLQVLHTMAFLHFLSAPSRASAEHAAKCPTES